ncbi:MAG: hypothetical protein IJZ88_01550 [Clostridia bacterium]|nr:hypothetical protein [Clostridia bacterium]
MRQSKKLLSVLLAVIMVFSTVAIAASAYAPWKDEAITNYDSLDKPVLTTEQYASAALDEVDRMLNEEQIMLTADDIFVGELNLTSIDAALDSIQTLLGGSLWTQFSPMLGDLANLDASALATPRRSANTTDSDLKVIYALLEFLYDNKGIFTGLIDGTLDLGTLVGPLLEDLLGGELDVTPLVKGLLYDLVYETDAPEVINETVDQMAQDLIDKLVIGTEEEPGLMPALEGYTDISTGSAYDFVDNILKVLYNEWIVPTANEKWIGAIDEMLAENMDAIEQYKSFFNLTADGKCNFAFQTYEFAADETFMGELNNILASIINLAITDELGFDWSTGDNTQIVPNLIKFGREVLCQTGDTFFASFVEVKTREELDAMTDMEVISYVARAIINSSVDGVWVPESADTLTEVANYTVKGIVAIDLPGMDYSDTALYPNDNVETIYAILGDYAAEALNDLLGLGIEYGVGIDGVFTELANWAITNYAGLLSGINLSTRDSGWVNLEKIFFTIINKNWINASLFDDGVVTFEALVKEVVLENILELNFDDFVSILTEEVPGSELQQPIKQVILNVLPRTINIIFPGLFATNMTTLEEIISKTNLANTVNALFSDLYNYRATLAAAVLPIVCPMLSLTNSQEFEAPEFDIPAFNYISTGAPNLDLTITNPSSGINTGYTDANGVFHQDARYAIKINSITSTLSGISIATPSNPVLDGGESVTVKVTGSFSGTQYDTITVNYDVLVEDGTKLTSEPLDARIYTVFSKSDTDEDKVASKTGTAASIVDGEINLYRTSISGLDDIELTVENLAELDENNPDVGMITVTPYAATAATAINKLSFMENVTETTDIRASFRAGIQIFKFIDEYDSYTDEQKLAAEEEAFTSNGFKRYYGNTGVTVNGTNIYVSAGVCLYRDYGLVDLFNSEANAQRQASDYTSADAWNAYIAAMTYANQVVNGVKKATTYCLTTAVGIANKYEAAAADLQAAVEALEATAAAGGAQSTKALLDSIQAPNEDGVEYDDAAYNYFGRDDYVAYTYENYEAARDEAYDLIEGSKIYKTAIDEETGEEYVPDWEDFTYGPVDALSVAYTNHRLSLYADRLLVSGSLKTNLNRAVAEANAAGYVSTDYEAESWAAYERAIAFATSVNNESAPRQTKINEAYVQLIEAQKRLMKAAGEIIEELIIALAGANPGDSAYAVRSEVVSGVNLLLGVFPEANVADVASYFDITGDATVECESIATGSTVTIYDAAGEVVAEYVLVITGDLDASGGVTVSDMSTLARSMTNLTALDSASTYAGDFDASGDIGVSDLSSISRVLGGLSTINFAAGTAE